MPAKKIATKTIAAKKVAKPMKNNLYTGGDGEPFKPTGSSPVLDELKELAANEQGADNAQDYPDSATSKEPQDPTSINRFIIGRFMSGISEQSESLYTICVGGPKRRVVIERFGVNPKIVFGDTLIEAIEKIGGAA